MIAVIEYIVQHSQITIIDKFVSKYGDSHPDINRDNLINLFLNNKTIIVDDAKPKRGRGRPKKSEQLLVNGSNVFKIKE